jgi:methylenetetrahydrofolate dehydrogenase (NADP+)/methenyltetrahydrofolate cyclohydrolase
MSATIIDGKTIAADLRAAVKAETARLTTAHGIVPGLAVVLLGDDAASQSYVASKSRAVTEVGMRPFDHHLPASVSEAELRSLVQKLNADPASENANPRLTTTAAIKTLSIAYSAMVIA